MQVVDAHGAQIPQIGLGTMTLKGDVCVQAVKDALQAGYRHLDTAWFYGNEKESRRGLARSPASSARRFSSAPRCARRISSRTNSANRSRKASPICNCLTSTCC